MKELFYHLFYHSRLYWAYQTSAAEKKVSENPILETVWIGDFSFNYCQTSAVRVNDMLELTEGSVIRVKHSEH